MKTQNLSYRKIFFHFGALIAALIFYLSSFNSYASSATAHGVERTRACDSEGNPEPLEFNQFTGGNDFEFVMSNPICITVIATTYAEVKLAIALMNKVCGTGSAIPRIKPSPLSDSIDIGKASIKSATSQNVACYQSIVSATTTLVSVMAKFTGIYATADSVFKNARVCGADWKGPNPERYDYSASKLEAKVNSIIVGRLQNSSAPASDPQLNFGDDTYDAWYFGGVKVKDKPGDGSEQCLDVTAGSIGNHPPQTYYMKGLAAGNFDCEKYKPIPGKKDPLSADGVMTESRQREFSKAYQCCRKRSQQYICLEYVDSTLKATENLLDKGMEKANANANIYENDKSRVFCKAGEFCTINGVVFSSKFVDNNRMICAETYSLCPYNISINGGTQYCNYYKDGKWDGEAGRWIMITQEDIDLGNCAKKSEIRNEDCTFNNKAGKCKNYCQYLTHCTTTSSVGYEYTSNLGSPYFSDACINFVGDSQNSTSYNGLLIGSQRHFSAPIAQCIKETIENLFYNRAGHSKCYGTEYPAADGSCAGGYAMNGTFEYKKGNSVNTESFFVKMQNNVKSFVRLMIIMSVTIYGFGILIGKIVISNKKELITYTTRIAVIFYFATGTAWQDFLFQGVYETSSEVGKLVFKIDVGYDELKRDGCQFGKQTLPDGTIYDSGRNYPEGKEYLAIWDTLDCKIARYLGYGPNASVANIASLMAAAFLDPTGYAIYFAVALMFLGLMFVAATVRALHIFLCSCVAIVLMVFISPVIIPTMLFERTKGIFDGWLKSLLSFCFHPVLLFAYIAFMTTIVDRSLIGSATFVGSGPNKAIFCDSYCKASDNRIVPNNEDGSAPDCNEVGQKKVNPMDDSVACLVNFNNLGKFPGLEFFGILIPTLIKLFEENPKQRILTIIKGALIVYLIYKFMDEISAINSEIFGTSGALESKRNAMEDFKNIYGGVSAVSKRVVGGISNAGKYAYNNRDKIKEKLGGRKGKSTKDSDSTDRAASSGGESADDASDSGGESGGGAADSGGSSDGNGKSDN